MKRLYRFKSRMKEAEVNKIIEELDDYIYEAFRDLIHGIDYVEFIDENGFESSLCSLSDSELDATIKAMNAVYGKGAYWFFDATQELLMGRHCIKADEQAKPLIESLIERHFEEYLTKDEVLDKISELGIESLGKIEYKVLES